MCSQIKNFVDQSNMQHSIQTKGCKMKKQWLAIPITLATAITTLFVLFWWMGETASGISSPALAAPAELVALSLIVTDVDPRVAPYDLDTPIVITGTGFTVELSGKLVITKPTA